MASRTVLTPGTFPGWLIEQARQLEEAKEARERQKGASLMTGQQPDFVSEALYRKATRLVAEAEARLVIGDLIATLIGLTEADGSIEVTTKDQSFALRVDWTAA